MANLQGRPNLILSINRPLICAVISDHFHSFCRNARRAMLTAFGNPARHVSIP
jgi:hypothetical protein